MFYTQQTPGMFYTQRLAWRGWSGDGGVGGGAVGKVDHKGAGGSERGQIGVRPW